MPRSKKARVASSARKPRAKHGGARAGAGRKRDALPADVLERLGDPPEDARGLRVWNARVLAEVQRLSMRGEIGTDLAASLRANAGAIDRALPPELPRSDDDDDEDEDDDGPAMIEAGGDGDSLRVE